MSIIKINERQIKEAIRIREEYLKSLKKLKENDKLMIDIKNSLNESYKMIKNPKNDIDKELIEVKINNLTKNIKDMQKKVQPIIEKIENLKKDANYLYENIKEKVPNATKENLFEILKPYMKKVDDKFNIF